MQTIHQPHDRFFKRSLKEKKIAIDFLKVHLPSEIYQRIDINTLELTDKSFILPKLREIHSDIIYKCKIDSKAGYLFFLIEAESTAREELMAFRKLQYTVGAMDQHLQQGHKRLPIIIPICLYHGERSPYPHPVDVYECFEDPELARRIALKSFQLIDLTILSDEEIERHGLASLMEMLFKHSRDKKLLSIMRQLLRSKLLQNVIKQLNIPYLIDMLNYIISTDQDGTEPNSARHLIRELIEAFPDKPTRRSIMTFAEQLREEHRQEFMTSSTFAEQLREQYRQEFMTSSTFAEQLKEQYKQEFIANFAPQLKREAKDEGVLEVAKKMLAKGLDLELIKEITGLSEEDFLILEN